MSDTNVNDNNVSRFPTARIGKNVVIPDSAKIGEHVEISNNVIIGNCSDIGNCVKIEENTTIGNHVIVGANTEIGFLTIIGDDSYIANDIRIGRTTTIGKNTDIHTCVQIGDLVCIGDNVTIKMHTTVKYGSVIGNKSVIFENVEIEDRAMIGHSSRIRNNAVIGKDTQLGSNVEIGEHITTSALNDYFISCLPEVGIYWKWVTPELKSPGWGPATQIKYDIGEIKEEPRAVRSDIQCDLGLHIFRVGIRPEFEKMCPSDHSFVCLEVEVNREDVCFGGLPGNNNKLRVKKLKVLRKIQPPSIIINSR